jgi:type I restriction enzyme M protein
MTKLEQDLLALVYQQDGSVGNQKAREELGVDEPNYELAKASLVQQGIVRMGRGRGGSVQLAIPKARAEQMLFEPVSEEAPNREAATQEAEGPIAAEPTGLTTTDLPTTQPPPIPYPTAKRGPGRPPKAQNPEAQQPKPTTPAAPSPKPQTPPPTGFQGKANFIWSVADDLLRGVFKAHQYGDVMLPFVVLRRLDQVLGPHKDAVHQAYTQFKDKLSEDKLEPVLLKAAGGTRFYNTSRFDLQRLVQDPAGIELNFNNYLNGYSANVREIMENFSMAKTVKDLQKNDRLYRMVDKFTEVDLSPATVSNHEMGYIFEELLRRFSEMSNETAGEHFTPREVIKLMVNILFAGEKDRLSDKGIIRTIFDPACGTGGMLTIARDHIREQINANADIKVFGQELNEQTFAIAKSDVLITDPESAGNIRHGDSFTKDRFEGQRFDYMLANPPYGVSWKAAQTFIQNEAKNPYGRFSAGLPRSSDGQLLFLQHMLSKMEPRGSRVAIVFNGSPLFTGDAGSGESDIRKWIIENDWLESIVAMPTQLFYNTGIATYLWFITNKKEARRRGKVQMINASGEGFYKKMRKSLGDKRQYIPEEAIAEVVRIYSAFAEGPHCKIFDNADLGFTKVTVERPQRDASGKVKAGKPDSSLRDTEKIPLKEDVDAYFAREVLPHVPDAWLDRSKDKVGYEINFTRYFYQYKALRPLAAIAKDILALEEETEGLLKRILE